jgi:acyl transferase domain-containing protein
MGHSLGAFTALYASGSLTLKDLLQTTRQRGLLMSNASSELALGMLAVSASEDECKLLLSQIPTELCIANMNSQEQTILSGKISDLERIQRELVERNISHKQLPVSTAFHSTYLSKIKSDFKKVLERVETKEPNTPVLSCLDSQEYTSKSIANSLVEEVTAPVRFMPTVKELYNRGVRIFLEVGPKSVLTKLTHRILRGETFTAIAVDEDSDSIFSLWNTLAQLVVAGVPMDLGNLNKEFAALDISKSAKNSFNIELNGANLRPQALPTEQKASLATRQKDLPSNPVFVKEKSTMDSRLSVAQNIQSEAAKIHSEFQKTFSETHIAFLKSTQHCFELLLRHESPIQEATLVVPSQEKPKAIQQNEQVKLPATPIATETHEPFKFVALSSNESVSSIKKEADSDLTKLLIETIAEKTGYPQDLIKVEMALDSDLGIDSIKRVEIFSQLSEKIPQAGSINPQDMNKLSTLQDIIEFLEPEESNSFVPSKKKYSSNTQTTVLND